MATGFPDWLRAMALLGKHGDDYVVLAVDENGQLYALVKGEDDTGTLHTLAVDDEGQLLIVPRGESGYYMNVDANGYLTTVMKGLEGATLRTITVDESGNLVAVMKGLEGANLRTIAVDAGGRMIARMLALDGATVREVAVDANGQFIIVPRGSTGNYMSVDSNGYLSSVMKGLEGATLRTVAVDANGNIVGVMQGLDGATLRTVAVDGSGQIIMVPRGQSGNYVDVDSDGYYTTVIKGDHDGALETVQVDDAGRLTAYIADNLDAWGSILQCGNTELATRLGSPIMYHRSGTVQLMETFESGLNQWYPALSGTGAEMSLAVDPVFSGGYSVKLVGGSTGAWYAEMRFRRGFVPAGKWGLSIAFHWEDAPDGFWIEMNTYDGTNYHNARMKIDGDNNELLVYNNTPAYVAVGYAYPLTGTVRAWSLWKFTVDPDTFMFDQVWFDGQVIDISAHEYQHSASAISPRQEARVRAISHNGLLDVTYVDDVVLTAAEP